MIPHYEQKYLQLLDKEDEEGVVEDNFNEFQQMYHKVWKQKFADVIDLTGGVFHVDQSPAAKRKLALQLNDNVFQNLSKFSVRSFDQSEKMHKIELNKDEKS